MAEYRCYFLNDRDRIQSAEDIEAERLDEAIDLALAMLGQRPQSHSIELWRGTLRLFASREQPSRHQCQIYEGAPSATLPATAATIDQKLKENLRCMYLNSPPMTASLRDYLSSAGIDVEQRIAEGALILSSEQEHLAGGRFDADRMLNMLERAIDQAVGDGYKGLWACGDMAWELGRRYDADQLLEYEWKLEGIFRRRPELSGICQYRADTVPRDLIKYGLAAHRAIFVSATLSRINPHYLAPFTKSAPHPELGDIVDELCKADPE